MKHKATKYDKLIFVIIMFLGVAWLVFHVNKGIDMEDSGFYMAKYRYAFDIDIETKKVSTLFTELIGGLVYKICHSYQFLILSVLGCISYFASAGMMYKVLKRKSYDIVLLGAVTASAIFSFSWIKMLNYNAISMFFQTLAIALILQSIKKEEKRFAFAAGIILAINIFVRLPNILQLCFGGVFIWYYGICEGHWKKCGKYVARFIAGVIVGGLGSVFIIVAFAGGESLFRTFFSTTNTLSSGQSRHGLINILGNALHGLETGVIMWAEKILILLLVIHIVEFFRKKWNLPLWVRNLLNCLIIFLGIWWGKGIDTAYTAGGMIGVLCVCVGIWIAFSEKYPNYDRAIACLLVLSEAVLTIGTDNGWYYQVVFMVFPMASLLVLAHIPKRDKERIDYVRPLYVFCMVTIMGFGIYYSATNVYRESSPYRELTYTVNIPECAGMRTSPNKGKALERLYQQLKALEEDNQSLAAFGSNSLSYCFTDMEPCFSHLWPDLEGFSYEEFTKEFEGRIAEGDYPVILFSDFDLHWELEEEEKYHFLKRMTEEYGYKKVDATSYYTLYAAN